MAPPRRGRPVDQDPLRFGHAGLGVRVGLPGPLLGLETCGNKIRSTTGECECGFIIQGGRWGGVCSTARRAGKNDIQNVPLTSIARLTSSSASINARLLISDVRSTSSLYGALASRSCSALANDSMSAPPPGMAERDHALHQRDPVRRRRRRRRSASDARSASARAYSDLMRNSSPLARNSSPSTRRVASLPASNTLRTTRRTTTRTTIPPRRPPPPPRTLPPRRPRIPRWSWPWSSYRFLRKIGAGGGAGRRGGEYSRDDAK